MPKVDNLKGRRFGRLLVLFLKKKRDNHRNAVWACRCACGKLKNVQGSVLKAGSVHSCGCYNAEVVIKRSTKHGQNKRGKVTPEYRAYTSAKYRCSPKSKQRDRYFDRGIKFLFSSFEQFFSELGKRPTKNHSLDRENNNGNYISGNVRWATRSEQQKNKGNRYKEQVVRLLRKIKRLERELKKCKQFQRK